MAYYVSENKSSWEMQMLRGYCHLKIEENTFSFVICAKLVNKIYFSSIFSGKMLTYPWNLKIM